MPPSGYVRSLAAQIVVLTSPPHRSQSHHRKTLAVKRADGEPLTRVDLQYDMLYHIFADKHTVFSDPYTTIRGDPAGTRVTFRDLYVNALIHSPRCSKASRDKIRESPEFGNEFAMISLLSNVGRINTTMACEWHIRVLEPPPIDVCSLRDDSVRSERGSSSHICAPLMVCTAS